MGMFSKVTPHRDHHKMVKALENCSLQATFGPEITSAGGLLAETSDDSSDVTVKASHNRGLSPVEKRTRLYKIPSFLAKSRTNPNDLTNKDGNTPSDPTIIDDIPIVLINKHGNIPYDLTTSRRMPAFPTYKDGMIPVRQSNFLGQIPIETWGRKASYHA